MAAGWIVLHVTERCQLDCLHCLRDPGGRRSDLPPAVLEKLLDEAVALHRVQHVGFTGGEPLLHPQLGALVDAAVRRGLTWHVVTNGRSGALVELLEADPARRAALTAVDLSLDGATAATHDAVRGAGSHREVMAAALALQARGVPFSIQMTLHALNVAELEEVGLLAAQLGAARVSFAMTQATGTPEDARLRLPLDGWVAARDRVERLSAALRIPVTAAEGFPRRQPFHVCEPWRSELLHVDPRGRLTLCCQLSRTPGGEEDVVADLATTSLADAHRALIDRVHALQRERLDALAAGEADPWALLGCNACLRRHGRPHWVDGGSAGPRARRAAREEG